MQDSENKVLKTNRKGFTLVEVLVALSILVIISLIGVLSLNGFNKQNKLDGERDKMMNALLDTQSASVSGKLSLFCVTDVNGNKTASKTCKIDGDCTLPETCENAYPVGGYGIKLENNTPASYTVFADINNDGVFDDPGEKLQYDGEKTLPSGIVFNTPAYYFTNITKPTDSYPIKIFFRKDSTIFIDGNLSGYNSSIRIQEISLKDTINNDILSTFFINRYSGLIYESTSPNPVPSP